MCTLEFTHEHRLPDTHEHRKRTHLDLAALVDKQLQTALRMNARTPRHAGSVICLPPQVLQGSRSSVPFCKHSRGWCYTVGVSKPLSPLDLVLECEGVGFRRLLPALATHPDQASSLLGSRRVSSDTLAVNNRTIGLGWQQSKRTLVLLAVVGACVRPRWRSP